MEVTWERIGQTFTDVWITWENDKLLGEEIGKAIRKAKEDYKKEFGVEPRAFLNQVIRVMNNGDTQVQHTIVVDIYVKKTGLKKWDSGGSGVHMDMIKPEPPTVNHAPGSINGINQYYNKPF